MNVLRYVALTVMAIFFQLDRGAYSQDGVEAEDQRDNIPADDVDAVFDSLGAELTASQLQKLMQMTADMTPLYKHQVIPGGRPTVADSAAFKLRQYMKASPAADEILAFIDKVDPPVYQFRLLVRAIGIDSLTDQQAARLQSIASALGEGHTYAVLDQLATNTDPVDERFDLLIDAALRSGDNQRIALASEAIANRRSRVLMWNTLLIDICEGQPPDFSIVATDFNAPMDARLSAFKALRKNGFPTAEFLEFLQQFDAGENTELEAQLLAAQYEFLGDDESLAALLAYLKFPDKEAAAAKILSQGVKLPLTAKQDIFSAVVAGDDLTSRRLSSVLTAQFEPTDFSEAQLEQLKAIGISRVRERIIEWIDESSAQQATSNADESRQ